MALRGFIGVGSGRIQNDVILPRRGGSEVFRGARQMKGATAKCIAAIDKAERFHKEIISDYYHPNTYAFCGQDTHHLSYGTVRWAGNWHRADSMDEATLRQGKPKSFNTPGKVIADFGSSAQASARHSQPVPLPTANPSIEFQIQPQDAAGDGTVNWQSGEAPARKVKRLFRTTGWAPRKTSLPPLLGKITSF